MSGLFDLLLTKPLSDLLLRGLLFVAFTLHILFALLTLGTAFLAFYYFIHAWCGRRLHEWRWDKDILRTFLAHKSFAVVMLILVPMLLTRQFIQDRKWLSFAEQLQTNAANYEKELGPYSEEALRQYQSNLRIACDKGETIYSRSCAFCHGDDARGNGPEAKNLQILPEDISAVRTTRSYFHRILVDGISGSAMPYFTYFDRNKLQGLVDHLDKRYHMIGLPGPISVKICSEALEQAKKVYTETCSACHGTDGRGSELSRRFKPPPPDFTAYSLSPWRAFEIITNGYPGTVMASFLNLKEEVRWGLIEILNAKRKAH
jgi:mono/diheme cytochrome c family protein